MVRRFNPTLPKICLRKTSQLPFGDIEETFVAHLIVSGRNDSSSIVHGIFQILVSLGRFLASLHGCLFTKTNVPSFLRAFLRIISVQENETGILVSCEMTRQRCVQYLVGESFAKRSEWTCSYNGSLDPRAREGCDTSNGNAGCAHGVALCR